MEIMFFFICETIIMKLQLRLISLNKCNVGTSKKLVKATIFWLIFDIDLSSRIYEVA